MDREASTRRVRAARVAVGATDILTVQHLRERRRRRPMGAAGAGGAAAALHGALGARLVVVLRVGAGQILAATAVGAGRAERARPLVVVAAEPGGDAQKRGNADHVLGDHADEKSTNAKV